MKSKVLFLIALFISSSLFSQPPQSLSIDLAIFLDQGDELAQAPKQMGPLTRTISNLIVNHANAVPFVASTSLLASIIQFSPISKNLEKYFNQFHFYKSENSDFIIALPKNYLMGKPAEQQKKINSLGFDADEITLLKTYPELESTLEMINVAQYKQLLSSGELPDINLEDFKKLFIPGVKSKTDKSVSPIKKRIFLMGHGGYASQFGGSDRIAGLPIKNYRQLLEYFNVINVDFLYLVSCYSGGEHFQTPFQKNDEKITGQIKPNYFIMVGSTTDSAVTKADYKFKSFFDAVGEFLATRKIKNCMEKDYFKCIQQALTKDFKLQNIASVRFPGTVNYFKAVDAENNLVIITFALATAKAKEKSSFVVDQKNGVNKEAILIYPINVQVPIDIKQDVTPSIVSMIPGNAFHIIPKLSTIDTNLDFLIRYVFFPIDIVSEKIFLIKKLEIDNNIPQLKQGNIELHNVMIRKNKGEEATIDIQFEFENNFYYDQIFYGKFGYEKITSAHKAKKDFVNHILTSSINNIVKQMKQDAIYSGHENIEEIAQQAIAQFTAAPESEAVEKIEKAVPFAHQK